MGEIQSQGIIVIHFDPSMLWKQRNRDQTNRIFVAIRDSSSAHPLLNYDLTV